MTNVDPSQQQGLRVLVVGCGYVGAKLASDFVAAQHMVSCLGRRPPSIPGARGVVADLRERASLDAIGDVDVAIFTAAPDARDEAAYRAVYVDGLRNLADSLSPSSRLVFASSTAVYGQRAGEWVDESSVTEPPSYRGSVLLEAEAAADVSLRLGGIYGPGRVGVVERLRKGDARCTAGRFLNWIHRDDAARALAHLATLPRPQSIYIGVDEEPADCDVFFRWLSERTGEPLPPADADAVGRNKRCSSQRLRDTGFEFRYPTFRAGFESVLARDGRAAPARVAPWTPLPGEDGGRYRPNCVSTQSGDERRRMPPLGFTVSTESARDQVLSVLAAMGGRVVSRDADGIRAEFKSLVFRFIDDVEVRFSASSKRVDYRSASRVGYADFGVNRRRMERMIRRLCERGDFFVLRDS